MRKPYVILFFFFFALPFCVQNHLLLASQVIFLIMSKLWSVCHLEITIPVGWVLNTVNQEGSFRLAVPAAEFTDLFPNFGSIL